MNLECIKQFVFKRTDSAFVGNIDKLRFLRLVIQGRAEENREMLELDDDGIKRWYDTVGRIKSLDEAMEMEFGIPFSGYVGKKKNCTAGVEKLVVRYDGIVFPCEAFKDDLDFILGNVGIDSLGKCLDRAKKKRKLNILKSCIKDSKERCAAQIR